MTRRLALNAFLLLALVAVVMAAWLATPDPARPNLEFLPQMAHSPRYNAFASNHNFTDGSTLHTPEPGTIPRGYMPLHYAATPQDAARAGEELQSPAALGNNWARQRGAFVFAAFCQECHGAGGAGNGPIVQRGFPPPPSLLADHARGLKDGQIFHIFTYGQNNMPSYASQISRQDRWYVIAYLRTLQATSAPGNTTAAGDGPPQPGGQP